MILIFWFMEKKNYINCIDYWFWIYRRKKNTKVFTARVTKSKSPCSWYNIFIISRFFIYSSLLSDFLSTTLLNDLFFCLNLIFHFHRFLHDFFKLLHPPHIRKYQDRLNIILTWSKRLFTIVNTIVYHDQHDHLNLKPFFHCLKRTTQSSHLYFFLVY